MRATSSTSIKMSHSETILSNLSLYHLLMGCHVFHLSYQPFNGIVRKLIMVSFAPR